MYVKDAESHFIHVMGKDLMGITILLEDLHQAQTVLQWFHHLIVLFHDIVFQTLLFNSL